MSSFFDNPPQHLADETVEAPAAPDAPAAQAEPPAPRPTHERATEVNNTQRVFDPSVADFSDTERAKRIYAERAKKG